MSTPIDPEGTGPIDPEGTDLVTDAEMAQIRQEADAAGAMSQQPLPLAPEVSSRTVWQSPIIAVFENIRQPEAPLPASPNDRRLDERQWRDDSIEHLVHSCFQMAHEVAASLRDVNRQVISAKIRQANHQLICQALTEAATFAEIYDRLQARAAVRQPARP